MNVFPLKSIGLYSLVIGGAIGFFQIVTSYGEANIRAPISIVGNYLITAPKLPNCLQNKQLLLKLQQSGIYLNASLIDRSQVTTMNKDRHPTLSGRLNSQKLNLTGLLPATLCDRLSPIHITGSFVNSPEKIADPQTTNTPKILAQQPSQLQGQLAIDNPDGSQLPFNFTGIIQPADRLPIGAATPTTPSH